MSTTTLMWLAGVACPAYVIDTVRPSRRRIGIAFVVAGALTLAFVTARRERAPAAPAVPDRPSWRQEMLTGAAPIANDTHDSGTLNLPGAVAWLLIWAALMDERREERGPWMLALIPLVLIVAIFAMGPVGPGGPSNAAAEAVAGGARKGVAIFVGVVLAYLAGVLVYWRLRRG